MSESNAVLFANEAFYRAFSDRDLEAMELVWSATDPITCIHPGWGLITGRDRVIQTWVAILGNPKAPEIDCKAAKAFVRGDSAHVVCYELINDSFLIASNYFAREGGRWRLVHHQAGPTSEAPPNDEPESFSIVN